MQRYRKVAAVYIYRCMYVCTYARVYRCKPEGTCVSSHLHTYTHVHMYIHTYTIRAYVRICVSVYVRLHQSSTTDNVFSRVVYQLLADNFKLRTLIISLLSLLLILNIFDWLNNIEV